MDVLGSLQYLVTGFGVATTPENLFYCLAEPSSEPWLACSRAWARLPELRCSSLRRST